MAATDTEFDEQRSIRELQAWETFRDRVVELQTLADARALLDQPPDDAGQQYYLNLADFLLTFAIPPTANRAERELYLRVLDRLAAAGEVKRSAAVPALAALRRSLGA